MVSLCFMPDTVIVILGVLLVVWWFLCACFMSDSDTTCFTFIGGLVVSLCFMSDTRYSLLVVSLFHA